MGRKSNDVESRKRKTKKDKARRKKELFGKYRLTRDGDTIASKKPKNQKNPKKKKNQKRTFQKVHKTKNQKSEKKITKKQKTLTYFFIVIYNPKLYIRKLNFFFIK